MDLIIKHARVVDGTGREPYSADVGLRDGKIAAIGDLSAAEGPVLDAGGRVLTPGFLDIHRHADLAVLRPGFGELELRQGLTTIVNGNCGLSCAPFGPEHAAEILPYLSPVIGSDEAPCGTMRDYLDRLRDASLPIHVGMLAGSGVLRADVAGFASGPLTEAQRRAVHRRMEQALSDGALGVSLGLGYAPDCFYDTKGLIEALAPLAGGTVPVTVHLRDEGSGVVRSVREMLKVAEALRCPIHLSHLKAIGVKNWRSKIPEVLTLLRQAREDGLDLGWDVYPYTAGSTQLLHVLPPEVLAGGLEATAARLRDPVWRERIRERLRTGDDFNNISELVGWDNIYLSSLRLPEHQALSGRSIAEAAALRGQDCADCCMDLLAEEHCEITMIDFITCEEDIEAILRSDRVSVISDATYPSTGLPHPRLYGTFVRAIERYVCQKGTLTLAQAVRRMSGAPAEALGLRQKGLIRVGMDADLNLFDPKKLHEVGTYAAPGRFPTGMDTVLVMGKPALWEGGLTENHSGTVL